MLYFQMFFFMILTTTLAQLKERAPLLNTKQNKTATIAILWFELSLRELSLPAPLASLQAF